MTPDVEAVIGRLTKRELDAVANGDPNRLECDVAGLLRLCLMGLATCNPDNSVRLLPLGLAVRQALLERSAK